MYNRKFKADKLDQSDIHRNPSTISTVPSLRPINSKNEGHGNDMRIQMRDKARIVSGEYYNYRTQHDSDMVRRSDFTAVTETPRPEKISVPKRRSMNVISKLGKRISTISLGLDKKPVENDNDTIDMKKRVVSMPVDSEFTFNKSVLEMYPAHRYPPKIVNNYPRALPAVPTRIIPQDLFARNISQAPDLEDQLSSSKEITDDRVYCKNNQIFVNLSDDSTDSLISKLISSYSNMDSSDDEGDDDVLISTDGKIPFFAPSSPKFSNKNALFEFSSPETTRTYNSSTYASTKESDVFSEVLLNGSNASNSSTESFQLESSPVQLSQKKINQFKLRDYEGVGNFHISDLSVPPQTPKHYILPTRTFSSPETPYYDCKSSFSRSPSPSSTPDSTKTVSSPIDHVQDTSKFTRQSNSTIPRLSKASISASTTQIPSKSKSKSYGPDISVLHESDKKKNDIRSTSLQYLKNAGIDPFMLNGYQSTSPLKVVN